MALRILDWSVRMASASAASSSACLANEDAAPRSAKEERPPDPKQEGCNEVAHQKQYQLHTRDGICLLEGVLTGELKHGLVVDNGKLNFASPHGHAYITSKVQAAWVNHLFS